MKNRVDTGKRHWLRLAALVSSALVVVACGSTAADSGGSTSAASSSPGGADGDGSSDGSVQIGVVGLSGGTEAAAERGVDGFEISDNEAQAQAVIDYLNENGGLADRTIEPIHHTMDQAETAADHQSEIQEMCADFTQDHHVFAVVSAYPLTDQGLSCLADAGVPLITNQQLLPESDVARFADYYYGPSDVTTNRQFRTVVNGLYDAGFFGTDPKIGVLYNSANETIVENDIEPTLAGYGLGIAESAVFDAGDPSGAQNQVLKFKSAGITHTLWVYTSPLYFMQAAESQGYRPAYGIDSTLAPGAVLQQNAPPSQLAGTVGIGWVPTMDVDESRQPDTLGPAQDLCHGIQEDAGHHWSTTAMYYADSYCDAFLTLQQSLDGAVDLSVEALSQGYFGLGDEHQSAVTFGSRIEPGRPDGMAAYRVVSYDSGCSCFAYEGENRATR